MKIISPFNIFLIEEPHSLSAALHKSCIIPLSLCLDRTESRNYDLLFNLV